MTAKKFIQLTLSLFFSFATAITYGQNWSEAKIFHPDEDITPKDLYGINFAIHGTYMAVGAPLNARAGGAGTGIVYIYENLDEKWVKIAELQPADDDSGMNFGSTVAMDEHTVVVQSSVVYVFTKPDTGWADMHETAVLRPKTDEYTYSTGFGYNLIVNNDIILVSATGQSVDDVSDEASGIVYVFEKPESGIWGDATGATILYPSTYELNSFYNFFGESIAIENDQIAVGYSYYTGIHKNQGAIFIYDKPTDGWTTMTETNILEAHETYDSHRIGRNVNYYNGKILTWGGSTLDATEDQALGVIFEQKDNSWDEYTNSSLMVSRNDEYFTVPRFIKAFDDHLFLGLYHEYSYDDKIGEVQIFPFPTSESENVYATGSLMISADGKDELIPSAIEFYNQTVLVGTPDDNSNGRSGAVRIYEKPATGWDNDIIESSFLTEGSLSSANDIFGVTVDISGNYAVIGAPWDDKVNLNTGAVYVVKKTDDSWQRVCKLTPIDGQYSDNFGYSVGIYNDLIVVGAPGVNQNGRNSGAVYIYEKTDNEWSNSITPTRVIPEANEERDYLGKVVDIHKGTIIASGVYTGNSTSRGKVYVIEKVDDEFQDVAQLTTQEQTPEFFGHSISIFEDKISVVATRSYSAPLIYVYERPDDGWQNMVENYSIYSQDNDIGINKAAFLPVINTDSTLFYSNYAPSKLTVDPTTTPWTFTTEYFNGKVIGHKYNDVSTGTKEEYFQSTYELSSSEKTAREAFGYSMAQSGNVFLASNFNDSIDNLRTGKVYVFDTRNLTSEEVNLERLQIQSSMPQYRANFGEGLALYGTNMIVGAPGENNQAGAAYIFENSAAYVKTIYSPTTGIFKIGDQIQINVVLSEDCKITGDPTLILNMTDPVPAIASFNGSSGPEVEFIYTIEEGNETENLSYLNEHSFLYHGEVKSLNDQEVNRVLPPVGSLDLAATAIEIDGVRPKLTITSAKDSTNYASILIQIELSEPIQDFTTNQLTVENGSISDLTGSDLSYTAQLTAVEPGRVRVFCEAGTILDIARNTNELTGEFEHVYDITPPTAKLYTNSDSSNLANITVSCTVSEPIVLLEADMFDLINATIVQLTKVSESEYSIDLSPVEDGLVSIALKENSITDFAENYNSSSSNTILIHSDRTSPKLTFTYKEHMPTTLTVVDVFVESSELLKEIQPGSFSCYKCVIDELIQINDTNYLLRVRPYSPFQISAYQVQDLFGNYSSSQSPYFDFDQYPYATIEASANSKYTSNQSSYVTIKFNESVYGLTEDDLILDNCIIDDMYYYEPGSQAIIYITAIQEGAFSITLKELSIYDESNNENQESVSLTIYYDITPPFIEQSHLSNVDGDGQIRILFNEPIEISYNFNLASPSNYINSASVISEDELLIKFRGEVTSDSIEFWSYTIWDLAGNYLTNLRATVVLSASSENLQPDAVQIHPNPVQGHTLNVINPFGPQSCQYEISDMLGKVLLKGQLTADKSSIDVSSLPQKSTYIIHVRHDDQSEVTKFIKL